jgi:hypothetical protein
MKILYARVVEYDCEECRNELIHDLRAQGFPMPTEWTFAVPASWKDHQCSHGRRGLVLTVSQNEIDLDVLSDRDKAFDADMAEPDWWSNLDATKGQGYYYREEGRFGSHPSRDRFDGDSEP